MNLGNSERKTLLCVAAKIQKVRWCLREIGHYLPLNINVDINAREISAGRDYGTAVSWASSANE